MAAVVLRIRSATAESECVYGCVWRLLAREAAQYYLLRTALVAAIGHQGVFPIGEILTARLFRHCSFGLGGH